MSMKKIFSVVCAVSVSAALFAGVPTLQSYQLQEKTVESVQSIRSEVISRQAAELSMENMYFDGVFHAPQIAKDTTRQDTTLSVFGSYDVYPYAFMQGTGTKLSSVFLSNSLYIPYNSKGALFVSNYTKGTWTLNDKEVAKDTAYIMVPTGEELDIYDIPTLQSNTAVVYDTTLVEKDAATHDSTAVITKNTINFKPYKFAEYYTSVYKKEYPTDNWLNGLDNGTGWAFMTKCQRYTNIEKYTIGGTEYDTYGNNVGAQFARLTATQRAYCYGSGLNVPFSAGSVLFDTIVSIVQNTDVIAIQGVTMGIYAINSAWSSYTTPVVDNVRLTLYPVTESDNGFSIDWEHPYASAVTNSNSFTPYNTTNSTEGTISFVFTEKDPDTGVEDATTISIKGSYAAVLTELNSGNNNFGILSDGEVESPLYAYTYLLGTLNGRTVTTTLWNNPMNLYINYLAVFPVITNAPEEINLSESTTATVTLNTNIESDLWDYETDEWLSIEPVDKTVTEGDAEYFLNEVELTIKATSTSVAREGKIIINALGKEYTIIVKQQPTTGIDNVKFLNDGKTYNLLGIEVDENYKGVVIRNGEKFIQ